MALICKNCGLPKELCTCEVIERGEQKIVVFVEKRKYNKPTTVIEGIVDNGKEMSSKLKANLACGGTFKNDRIELQGDHRNRIKEILIKLGYSEDQIEVSQQIRR